MTPLLFSPMRGESPLLVGEDIGEVINLFVNA